MKVSSTEEFINDLNPKPFFSTIKFWSAKVGNYINENTGLLECYYPLSVRKSLHWQNKVCKTITKIVDEVYIELSKEHDEKILVDVPKKLANLLKTNLWFDDRCKVVFSDSHSNEIHFMDEYNNNNAKLIIKDYYIWWLECLYSLESVDESVDIIFEEIEELMSNSKFQDINEILVNVDVERLSIVSMLAFLSITKHCDSLLFSREHLSDRIEHEIGKREPYRVCKLMKNLK